VLPTSHKDSVGGKYKDSYVWLDKNKKAGTKAGFFITQCCDYFFTASLAISPPLAASTAASLAASGAAAGAASGAGVAAGAGVAGACGAGAGF